MCATGVGVGPTLNDLSQDYGCHVLVMERRSLAQTLRSIWAVAALLL